MAREWGVTATGFASKSLSTLEGEIDAGLRSILGDSAGSEEDGSIPPQSLAGQLKTWMVDREAAHWDLMQAVHASFDPNKATAASLDAICSLTGTQRNAASRSVSTGTAVGDAGTFLSEARSVGVTGTGSLFASTQGATLAAASAWAALTAYSAGALRSNNSRIYRCTASGTSAASVGPSGTALSITDGSATWRHLGAGLAFVHVPFAADDAGPIGALAYQMSSIETPVSGWNAISNENDAEAGAHQENDAALRVRRDAELATAGNTTVDAIRAAVSAVNEGSTDPNHEPPTSITVFFNDTDVTDADGVPPHSVEVLVQDGTAADIVQAIWDSVGAGTRTYGTSSGTATDSEKNSQTVYYTRPTEVPIWVVATLKYDANAWEDNSQALVAQYGLSALLTYTEDFPIARDPRTSPLIGAIMRGPAEAGATGAAIVPADPDASPIPGLLEVESLFIHSATGASGFTAQISISRRQLATFASARCDITASTETQ